MGTLTDGQNVIRLIRIQELVFIEEFVFFLVQRKYEDSVGNFPLCFSLVPSLSAVREGETEGKRGSAGGSEGGRERGREEEREGGREGREGRV